MTTQDDRNRPGLGRVVYSVDDSPPDDQAEQERDEREERAARAEVDEADKESFPASDAPSFAGSSKPDTG
jgi:hypothetical protein